MRIGLTSVHEPQCEISNNVEFRPGLIQISLYNPLLRWETPIFVQLVAKES